MCGGENGKLQSPVGDHGKEKDQSVPADQGVWLKLRSDEPSEKEYICLYTYAGDALQDLKLQCRRHRTHLILSPARKRFKNGWSLSESFSGKDQRP